MDFIDSFLLKRKMAQLPPLNLGDDAIVAVADGELFDVSELFDPVFAGKMLGDSVAIRSRKRRVVVCSPANGTIRALFPTGHAFGVETDDGVELLVHCGIDTVMAHGEGFTLADHKIGDRVKAGDPIVMMDQDELSDKYDTSIILIVTNPGERTIQFIEPQEVSRGMSVIR